MTRRPRTRVASQTRARLRGLHFNRLIPNILTVLALCAGLTAILYAYQSNWKFAVIAILIAAVLDALDGRVARLLGGSTKFGAELDSLSDFVSFGVAPALLVFLWSLQSAQEIGWITALVFAVCAALRLARFNTRLGVSDMPAWASNYFTGVPAPAGGGLALLPMILSFTFQNQALAHPAINIPVMVIVACLMISRIPTYALKQVRVPHRMVMPFLLLVGLTAALLAMATWLTISVFLFAYLLSIPFSVKAYRRLQRDAANGNGGAKSEEVGPDETTDRVFEEIADAAQDDGDFGESGPERR